MVSQNFILALQTINILIDFKSNHLFVKIKELFTLIPNYN